MLDRQYAYLPASYARYAIHVDAGGAVAVNLRWLADVVKALDAAGVKLSELEETAPFSKPPRNAPRFVALRNALESVRTVVGRSKPRKGSRDGNERAAARTRRRLDFFASDGQWVARITLPDGKRRTYYARSRRAAGDKLRAAQKSLDDGLSLDSDRETVAQFLDKWLAASAKPSLKTKTYEELRNHRPRPRSTPHWPQVSCPSSTPS